jgi:hypothetical protein
VVAETCLETSSGFDGVNVLKFNCGKPVEADDVSIGFVSVSTLEAPRLNPVKLVEPAKLKDPVGAVVVVVVGTVEVVAVKLGVVVAVVEVAAGEPNKPAEGVEVVAPIPPPRPPPSLKPPALALPPKPNPEPDEVDVAVVAEGAAVVEIAPAVAG